jgi:NADH:ubiquinone oxidoreductase subunit 4 (subunit M)
LLNGFIGEFLVMSGAFQDKAVYGILAATGVIWSAVYLLWMYQRVFLWQGHARGEQFAERSFRLRKMGGLALRCGGAGDGFGADTVAGRD